MASIARCLKECCFWVVFYVGILCSVYGMVGILYSVICWERKIGEKLEKRSLLQLYKSFWVCQGTWPYLPFCLVGWTARNWRTCQIWVGNTKQRSMMLWSITFSSLTNKATWSTHCILWAFDNLGGTAGEAGGVRSARGEGVWWATGAHQSSWKPDSRFRKGASGKVLEVWWQHGPAPQRASNWVCLGMLGALMGWILISSCILGNYQFAGGSLN